MGILKVSFTLGKLCICRLCNKKSTNDPSPLASARDNNAYGGKRPRARYKNVQSEDGTVYRMPSGGMDIICLQVWRALGL